MERIGICRIAETVPHVELAVIVPSLAAMDLNAALAVEGLHVVRTCSKAPWRESNSTMYG